MIPTNGNDNTDMRGRNSETLENLTSNYLLLYQKENELIFFAESQSSWISENGGIVTKREDI